MIESDEVLCAVEHPRNGAGMFWCRGCSQVARSGEAVFATTYEVGADAPLYSNTRWQLWRRDAGRWRVAHAGPDFEEREPACLAVLPEGRILMSLNTARRPIRPFSPATPRFLEFSAHDPERPPREIVPRWPSRPAPILIDHSYRGLSADPDGPGILLLHQDVYTVAQHNWPLAWTFMDADGQWPRTGRIDFPTRGAYPHVALRRRAAHVMAIEDMWEPNPEWHARKLQANEHHKEWDYVFRRLYYTWTPDIMRQDFAPVFELDNVAATAGNLCNCDLWLAPDGAAHLLYRKRNLPGSPLRETYWPDVRAVSSLEYAVAREGQVVRRHTLLKSEEPEWRSAPGRAFFLSDPAGRLRVLCTVSGPDVGGRGALRVLDVDPAAGPVGEWRPIECSSPPGSFCVFAERDGAAPSPSFDMLTLGEDGRSVRYLRIVV